MLEAPDLVADLLIAFLDEHSAPGPEQRRA